MVEKDHKVRIAIYPEANGEVEVRLLDETIWLTQRQMGEVFDTSSENVLMHLNNIFADGELEEEATTKDFLEGVYKSGSEPPHQPPRFGEPYPGFSYIGPPVVVHDQPPGTFYPGMGALNDPSFGEYHKALWVRLHGKKVGLFRRLPAPHLLVGRVTDHLDLDVMVL